VRFHEQTAENKNVATLARPPFVANGSPTSLLSILLGFVRRSERQQSRQWLEGPTDIRHVIAATRKKERLSLSMAAYWIAKLWVCRWLKLRTM
jgi:hypothetical protein